MFITFRTVKKYAILFLRFFGNFAWRREWDSNPRKSYPLTRFPSVRLKPLGHLSRLTWVINLHNSYNLNLKNIIYSNEKNFLWTSNL